MNFEQVYSEYLEYARNRHKKQGFITIQNNFDNHVLPYFKSYNINDITKLDVIEWQNDILSKNFSNKYNAHLYYAFNDFLNYCICCSYIQVNVVKEVGTFKKKIEYKEHKTYNLFEFIWFRLHLDNYIIKQYFNFMYFYGTRPGETMAFRFSDLKGKIIKVNHSLQRKGSRELDTPKNQSSVRRIKINIITRFRLWKLRRYYVRTYGDSDYDYFIFGGKIPLAPTTIDRHKRNACISAKIKELTQHEFRHSYATRMIKRKPINFVSKSMGHSKISTTLDIYVH